MNRDPIIDLLHQVKEAEARECDNSVTRLGENLRARRANRRQDLVRYAPQRRLARGRHPDDQPPDR
jgi:hypothetical protein